MERSSWPKTNGNTAINWHARKTDLTDIYRTVYLNTTAYTLFTAEHGSFSKIDHILGPK